MRAQKKLAVEKLETPRKEWEHESESRKKPQQDKQRIGNRLCRTANLLHHPRKEYREEKKKDKVSDLF